MSYACAILLRGVMRKRVMLISLFSKTISYALLIVSARILMWVLRSVTRAVSKHVSLPLNNRYQMHQIARGDCDSHFIYPNLHTHPDPLFHVISARVIHFCIDTEQLWAYVVHGWQGVVLSTVTLQRTVAFVVSPKAGNPLNMLSYIHIYSWCLRDFLSVLVSSYRWIHIISWEFSKSSYRDVRRWLQW